MMERDFIEAIRKIPTVAYKTFVEDFVKASFEMCLKQPVLMKRTFQIEKSEETLQLIFESRRHVANELSQIIKEKFNLKNNTDLKVYLMVHSYMGIIEAFVSSSSPYSVDEIQKLYSNMIVKMLDC